MTRQSTSCNGSSGIQRRELIAGLALTGGLAAWPSARAQSFPTKPIKVLIGVPAGGTQDILTRAIADAARNSLGPIIIDNKAGAVGRNAAETVKNAEPDGHTLLLGPASVLAMFPSAYAKLNLLATSGAKRSPPMPGIPSFAESGYKDVVASAWFAYFAPARTPQPVLDKLRTEFAKAVNSREVRQQLLINGMYPVGDGPDALRKAMAEDTARWAKIMKATNFVATE